MVAVQSAKLQNSNFLGSPGGVEFHSSTPAGDSPVNTLWKLHWSFSWSFLRKRYMTPTGNRSVGIVHVYVDSRRSPIRAPIPWK
jgi:hypothetical protein